MTGGTFIISFGAQLEKYRRRFLLSFYPTLTGEIMLTDYADGERDAAPTLQAMLDQGGKCRVSPGTYLLGETLRLPSDTALIAEPGTCFRLADGVATHCRHFMVTNANPGNGNSNIALEGGKWDANNAGNPRGPDGDPFAYSGVAINFTNVEHLTLRNLHVHNPESFFIRVGEVRHFLIEDIDLSADVIRLNQDGVHVGGFSEHGIIRRIRATGEGVPNDDMVALNADDDVERQLNLGMRRGPIRHLLVEDIEAEDAYTFIRLLSVDQPVEDIVVRRLRGKCRIHGINLNNWRFPKGVGAIRRVRFEDIHLSKTQAGRGHPAIVRISLAVDDVRFVGLQRGAGTLPEVQTLLIDNDQHLTVECDGEAQELPPNQTLAWQDEELRDLVLRRFSMD